MFFYVNSKAIFCLALVATLANFVLTQNLYTSILDDARDSLMSFSSGSSSPKPATPDLHTPPRFHMRVSSTRRTSRVSLNMTVILLSALVKSRMSVLVLESRST